MWTSGTHVAQPRDVPVNTSRNDMESEGGGLGEPGGGIPKLFKSDKKVVF